MRCPKECSKGKKPIVTTKLPKLGSEEREKRIVAPKLPKMGGEKIVATKLPKLEYILYSFPIKPNILISHIESMSRILFCVFISPSRYKRQHVPSLFALHLLTESYIFHIVSLTSNCSLLFYSSALLQCAQLRIVSFGLM